MVVHCNTEYINEEYNSIFSEYPFPLSDFQKYAIEGIVKGDHVLVTAHTGSGKTLPAEFAIKHFVGMGKKVIYTSPIKALSNQKFYDFNKKFPGIQFGLFTGDIKTNPEADVLIMTTEILMNTLFNKNETKNELQFQIDIMNELAAVVFDEVHYINDPERGQVWEKTILMLPPHIQMIMLSATIDDPNRFAKWCEDKENSTKSVYLSTTNHRVVPLTHYNYVTANESSYKIIKDKETQQLLRKYCNNIHCIQTDKGHFQTKAYSDLIKVNEILMSHKQMAKKKFVLNNLTKFLKDNDMLPAIGFVFSRKQVEQCARDITTPLLEDDSKIPYNVKKECDQIMRRLSNHEEYKRLPEYVELVSLLEKGIGVHHSGMIPILREMVELCISKNYIKLLFATESFAIGLDCPIKTAMFLSLTKFDGNTDRSLYPHEYTQMSGRAGRRGIDKVGHVIHCNNLFKPPGEGTYKDILSGKPPKLTSKYRISYDMVLNILRKEENCDLEKVIQFTNNSMMHGEIEKEIKSQEYIVRNIQGNRKFHGKTPYNVCSEYNNLVEDSKKYGNKKRKEAIKNMKKIEGEYDTLLSDMKVWKIYEDINKENENKKNYLTHLEEYIVEKTRTICNILETDGMISSSFELTSLGKIASEIAEVDSVIWTKCIFGKWEFLKFFDTKQIIGLFSCATDIKVNQEYRSSIPITKNKFLEEKINQLKDEYRIQSQIENSNGIISGINYELPIVYDIIDESIEWCNCETEEQCKLFIREKLSIKGIALGDFTKAMMKIATIAREFQSLSEHELCKGHEDLFYKLSEIEDMVLKYIATNQSLYV